MSTKTPEMFKKGDWIRWNSGGTVGDNISVITHTQNRRFGVNGLGLLDIIYRGKIDFRPNGISKGSRDLKKIKPIKLINILYGLSLDDSSMEE